MKYSPFSINILLRVENKNKIALLLFLKVWLLDLKNADIDQRTF